MFKSEGQSDLELQVFRIVQDLQMNNKHLKFEGKISAVQKLLNSQGITQNF